MDRNPASKNTRKEPVVHVPKVHNIPKSKEPGFELDSFMNDFKPPDTLEGGADNYFDSYSHFGIHEEMLKDRVKSLFRNFLNLHRLEPLLIETLLSEMLSSSRTKLSSILVAVLVSSVFSLLKLELSTFMV